MLRDAVESVRNKDHALAEEVIKRDEEIDRFYLFIVRQLTMAVLNRSLIEEIGLSDPRDCLVYRVVSKSLERIADHATAIAQMTNRIDEPLPARLGEALAKVSELTNTILEDSFKALAKGDGRVANGSIASAKKLEREAESIMDKLYDYRLNQKTMIAVRLALESLKRITEYSEDIAEMAINLTARRRQLF